MIKAECNNCGKSIKIYPSHIKVHKYHFCSNKCRFKSQGKWISKRKEVKCDTCDKIISLPLSLIKKHKHHFCSKKCMGKGQSKFRIGKNNPTWKGGKVEVKCEICEKTFLAHTSMNQRFCSEKCMLNALHKHNYKQIKIKCKQCGKIFNRTLSHIKRRPNPFCSKDCSNKYFTNRIDVKCAFCGKTLKRIPSNIKKIRGCFCNRKCFGNFVKNYCNGENGFNWRGGISKEPYSFDFNDKLKEQIRKRDNYTCQKCGNKSNGRKLSIHHIDYQKKNTNPTNLIALCVSCNSKVNANREHWTNYFQETMETLNTMENNI